MIKNFDIQLNNAQYSMTINNKKYSFEIISFDKSDKFKCRLWERNGSKISDIVEEFIIDKDGNTKFHITEMSKLVLKHIVFPAFYPSLRISGGVTD